MSALPQKKLCWNCEGNVAKNIDNCPYCGVYIHGSEEESSSLWNPSYTPSLNAKEIPSPLYQANAEQDISDDSSQVEEEEEPSLSDGKKIFQQLKRDVFPILFLMMGSIFFLFGIVLLLFSQNGGLTLHWNEKSALYFLLTAIPLVAVGWFFFQQLED